MKTNRKAIIVNGITDMNKGDQALVWESYRLIADTGLFNEIKVISLGDTKEEYDALCGQTIDRGMDVIQNVLKHPRRGKHNKNELQKEGAASLIFQIKNAVTDYVSLSLLSKFITNKTFVKTFYGLKIQDTVDHFKSADTIFRKVVGFYTLMEKNSTVCYVVFFILYEFGKKTE